jgi:hypothetical protein
MPKCPHPLPPLPCEGEGHLRVWRVHGTTAVLVKFVLVVANAFWGCTFPRKGEGRVSSRSGGSRTMIHAKSL